jgi:hypothetical protein
LLLPPIVISSAKTAFLMLTVTMTFLALIAFGLSADGHDLYSDDHLVWREAVYVLIEPAFYVGGSALWLFALIGGQTKSGWRVLARATVAIVVSVLLMQIAPFNNEFGRIAALVVGGALAAVWAARHHSWIALGLASAPYMIIVFAVAVYFAFAPPNIGPPPA